MRKKSSLTVIFLTVFIDLVGFGLLIPILPTFASKELGVSDFGIGMVVAVFSLMQFIFNPIMGRLSDRIGRRPVILVSLLLTCTSYIIFSFAGSFLALMISRILAGFGSSNIGAAQAYIADITTDDERAKGMGMIGVAFGLGFVFGPFIGGMLANYGYSVVGFGAALFSFTAFLFALFVLPESNVERKENQSGKIHLFNFKQIKFIFSHPQLGLLVTLFFIIVFSMANIYGTFAILTYKIYHLTDQQTGYLFGISGLVSTLMQGGAIRILTKKFHDRTLVLSGIFFMIFGLGLLPYGINIWGVGLVMAILSVGTGILQPLILSLVSRYSPSSQQGSILGLNQSFSALARVLGPLWGGFAFDYLGYQFPFLTGGFFTAVTFIFAFILLSNKRLSQDQDV